MADIPRLDQCPIETPSAFFCDVPGFGKGQLAPFQPVSSLPDGGIGHGQVFVSGIALAQIDGDRRGKIVAQPSGRFLVLG